MVGTKARNSPITLGGSGAGTAPDAVRNLGLVAYNHAGQKQGPVLLDEFGVVRIAQRPAGVMDPSAPSLNGPLRMYVTFTTVFKITNYDTRTSYSFTATGGTLTQVGEDLVYVAGSQSGQGSITINGVTLPIILDAIPIAAPIITYPLDGTGSLLDKVVITTTAFMATQTDTHRATDWQIATDPDFANVVINNPGDTVNKVQWQATGLQPNTSYYVRARHVGAIYGASLWGPTNKFSTLVRFVPNAPTVTSPATGTSGLATAFAVASSAFVSLTNDTHKSSDWQLATDAAFTAIVKQSLNDTTNKTSWAVSGLNYGTKYYIRVRHTGTTYGASDWSVTSEVSTSGVILLTGDLLGGGGAGQGGAFNGIFGNSLYCYAYGGYGGNAAPTTPLNTIATSKGVVDVVLGNGGVGGGPPPFGAGYRTGTPSTDGAASTIALNTVVKVTAPGGTAGAFNYSSVSNGDHDAFVLAPGGPGGNSKYGAGGPYYAGVGKAPTGGYGAGGSGASCSARNTECSYAVGGDGGPGYAVLQYPNTYPMPASYTGGTYQNTGGYHTFTFKVSGQLVFGAFEPVAPTIISPVNGATNQGSTVNLMASAFNSPIGSSHVSTDWQVATDAAFTNIFKQSLANTINKTSWSVAGLSPNTTYYVRVRYTDAANGTSAYSATSSFKTLVSFTPNTPTVTAVYDVRYSRYVSLSAVPGGYTGTPLWLEDNYGGPNGYDTLGKGVASSSAFSSSNPSSTLVSVEWSTSITVAMARGLCTIDGTTGTSANFTAYIGNGDWYSLGLSVRHLDNYGNWSAWSQTVYITCRAPSSNGDNGGI